MKGRVADRLAEAPANGRPWWDVMWSALSAWGWILLVMVLVAVCWIVIRRVRIVVFHARLRQG
ncbi:MAG: hypothetical protein K6T83_14125 [Alicyclobacillus sp.]|nr:hypothetical protein [Alicyclobacillus sp.]